LSAEDVAVGVQLSKLGLKIVAHLGVEMRQLHHTHTGFRRQNGGFPSPFAPPIHEL
jgi:hypothetical protein